MNQVLHTHGKEKDKDFLTSFTSCQVNKHRDMQRLTLTVLEGWHWQKYCNSMANSPAWPSATARICSWRTGRTIAEPAKWANLSSA